MHKIFVSLILASGIAAAQTNMGPIRTPQINQDLFVGQSGYPTIQSAVTHACSTGSRTFAVVIPAGSSPSDTPTSVTGACPLTYIVDQRGNSLIYYNPVGSHYVQTPIPMLYPLAGLAVSTGVGWGASIDPATIIPHTITGAAPIVTTDIGTNTVVSCPTCGSGAATFPGTNGVVFNTSTTTSRTAISTDIYNTITNSSLGNQYLVPSIPAAPGGSNVLFGSGVGPNMSTSGGLGGDSNVFMGFNAAHAATTQRESVVIGAHAGENITGNGSGPDDMIFVLIGSDAGQSLTNLGGASVMIGQKSGESATNSIGDVFLGIHSANNLGVSSDNVVVGATAFQGVGLHNADHNVMIGSCVACSAVAGSTIGSDVVIGAGAGSQMDSNSGNTIVGTNAGQYVNGLNNVLLGISAGQTSVPMTGFNNIFIGAAAGTNARSGSRNFVMGQTGGPSDGSNNVLIGDAAGNGIRFGNANTFVGAAAGQNSGDVNNGATAIGAAAGFSAQSPITAVGYNAGVFSTGDANTFVGTRAAQSVRTGVSNTIVGDFSGASMTGAESNDTAIGAGADIATGISGAAEIGPGQCATSNTLCFKGTPVVLAIASGTATLGTSAIASGGCATVVTVAGTGILVSDSISWNPNASIKAVTGYIPSTSGGLTITPYPTVNNVNFDVCNWSSASITPGAVTLNWKVTR